MNIQNIVDQLNKNLIRDFNNIPQPMADPETWQCIRWIIIELQKQGIAVDNHRELEKELLK